MIQFGGLSDLIARRELIERGFADEIVEPQDSGTTTKTTIKTSGTVTQPLPGDSFSNDVVNPADRFTLSGVGPTQGVDSPPLDPATQAKVDAFQKDFNEEQGIRETYSGILDRYAAATSAEERSALASQLDRLEVMDNKLMISLKNQMVELMIFPMGSAMRRTFERVQKRLDEIEPLNRGIQEEYGISDRGHGQSNSAKRNEHASQGKGNAEGAGKSDSAGKSGGG